MKFVKHLLSFLVAILAVINVLWLKSPLLGVPIGLAYLFYFSFKTGGLLSFRRSSENSERLMESLSERSHRSPRFAVEAGFARDDDYFKPILGFLFLCTYLIITGSIFYYLIGLHDWNIAIILLLPTILINSKQLTINNQQKIHFPKFSLSSLLIVLLLLLLLLILIFHRSTSVIVSPWQVIPSYFFVVYFLLSLVLFYKIIKHPENKNGPLIFLYILLSSAVALVVYKIGYGFDPFVHRAAEKIISLEGVVLPKTPYYIGQYSLVIIFSKLFAINFSFFDKILAPALGSILIPTLAYFTLVKNNFSKSAAQFSAVFAGLLTLFSFFFTTPQHLANIFLICFVFFAFAWMSSRTPIRQLAERGDGISSEIPSVASLPRNDNKKITPFLWFLALAITFIHPLAGISALTFCLFLSLRQKNKLVLLILLILSIVAVPLAFFLASLILPNFQLSFHWQNLRELLISAKNSVFYLPFDSFLHSLYLLKIIFYPLVIILSIFGFYKFKKTSKSFFILASLILLINALALKLFTFQSVINYEQNIFPLRLVHSAYFFILPFVLIALAYIFEIAIKTKKGVILLLIGAAFCAVSILYLVYPRYDTIIKNKGFAVSADDLTAVRLVEGLSANKNYLVLANQSTAAAALQEFGFKKYYNGTFYYPLPTSSPLYKIYLNITYQGIKPEFISEAKKITGVDTVFVIFADYWTNFKKLIPAAKQSAKVYFEINNGKIWVFEY
ncbi:MAG: hypothetical protein PHT40_00730 [Patescibacteria group bacterium]|nr:hypothetical protein [Patescibacteria group bacterium]